MKFDLHIHTKYSLDGKEEPEKIAKFLKKIGYNGMAITDHETTKGVKTKIDDFLIIPGEEIKTNAGHILALGIYEEIKSRDGEEVIEEIHDNGGIAVIAHPFRFSRPRVKKIDAVEIINGRNFPIQNKRAIIYARKLNYPVTGGSDGHFIWEMGRVYTIMNAENVDDAIEEIKKGRTEVGSNMVFYDPLKSSFFSFLDYVRRGFKRV